MNDEGIGIAGWLLADLTLVLALIFLALVPGRAAEPETPMPTPTPTATASPTPTPTPTPEAAPSEQTYQATFNFDQLVLSGIGSDHTADALAEKIANARVREGLRKEQEDTKDDDIDDWSWDLTADDYLMAEELLRRRQAGGWRIALIETFSRSHPVGNEVTQSRSVNEAFFTYLRERRTPPNGCIFLGGPDTVENDWTAAYLDRTHLDAASSRINLYFVWEPDAACDPSP